jgi:hypothetical protein
MGLWAYYFLATAYLHARGVIRFEALANLLFALLLVAPLPSALASKLLWKRARHALALAAALALFWHETWLPSVPRAVRLVAEMGSISPAYFARLVGGAVSLLDAGVLLALLAACAVLERRIILSPFAFAAIVAVPLFGARGGASRAGGEVDRFFDAELRRAVPFPDRAASDFDIVLVHVCSMSWDDLRATGLDRSPFFRQFDLLLTDFNTASSYTNPSAIRLLRSSCGQVRHAELYREAKPECYLLDALRRADYQTWSAIDNDAPSYRFVEDIRAFGHADAPLPLGGLAVRQHNFDESPIYDDSAVLRRWLEARSRSAARRAALYVDFTTMHGGAHPVDEPRWWQRSRADLYRELGQRLFANLEGFFRALQATGRRTVVVFVPEHGAALRGTSLQPPDIREIPLPAITTVPVAFKFIGPGLAAVPIRQATVAKPTSYLALAYLLAAVLESPKFGPDPILSAEVLARVPETRFVAENEAALVVRVGEEVLWRGREGAFEPVPAAGQVGSVGTGLAGGGRGR